MGKFSTEIEELIPDWKEAFIAYSFLKIQVKEDGESAGTELEVRVFFERLDEEREFVEPGEIVNKQLETWLDLQRIHREPNKLLGDFINGKDIQRAEKMIRDAFVELYKALGLLTTYNSLNRVGFTKVLKKFGRVADQKASASYLKVVETSHFISSDKVVRLMDDVESILTKHFANNDRKKAMKSLKKAMKFLKSQQHGHGHGHEFLTGAFVGLFSVYALLAYLTGIFEPAGIFRSNEGGSFIVP